MSPRLYEHTYSPLASDSSPAWRLVDNGQLLQGGYGMVNQLAGSAYGLPG